MKKVDIAYIAGLFDGEGDVGIYPYRATKNGKYYPKLTARIHNTNRESLDWTADKLGFGRVYRDRIGVKKSGNAAKKQAYVFMASHRTAREFLKIVRPFLIIKRNKVDDLLQQDKNYMNRNLM